MIDENNYENDDRKLAKKVQKRSSKNKRRENKVQLDNLKYMNEDEMFNVMDDMES